jgi:predicted dehydrogenase
VNAHLKPTNVGAGFVGGGFMATVHSRAARTARARLVGLTSSSAARSRESADLLGVERAYDNLDQLLADDSVEIVHICTPNALHAEQALAVVGAGKHLICEKPLATTSIDARALVDAAADAGVVATVPFVYRFHPMVREARARFRDGEPGRLLSIQGSYLQDWLSESSDDNWRVDARAGGASRAFADIGSHLVDLVEFVTGDRIARVAATKRTFLTNRARHRSISTEDAAAVVLETHGGAIGTLLVSQVAPGRKNRLHLEIAGRRKGSQLIPRDADQQHPDAARLSMVPAGQSQGYQDAFNAFVADSYAAVKGEAPDGLPRFSDGLRAVLITEAVMVAAVQERWVEVAKE